MSAVEFVVVEGVRTRVARDGTGEPMVIVHGGEFGMLDSLSAWDPNVADLRQDFSVLRFDRLGQGHTGNPPSPEGYTFAAVLDHIVGVIEAYDVAGAHLIGHSRGGLFAARLAQTRPDLVRTLVVVDSNSLAPDDPSTPVDFYERLEARLTDGYRTLDDACLEQVAQSFSSDHVTEDYARQLLEIAQLPTSVAAREIMATIRYDRWYPDVEAAREVALREVDERGFAVPTHLIWGRDDPSAPRLLGSKLLDRIAPRTATCTLSIVNRAGHYVFREQSGQFNALVRASCRG